MIGSRFAAGRAAPIALALAAALVLGAVAGALLWLSGDPGPAAAPVTVDGPASLAAPVFTRSVERPDEALPLAPSPAAGAPGAAAPDAAQAPEHPPAPQPPPFAGRLLGSVRDELGLPVTNAPVLYGARRTRTDGHGRFAFEQVVPEPANATSERLLVRHEGFISSERMVRLPSPDRPVLEEDVVLVRAGALAGRVTDDAGRPLQGLGVRVSFAYGPGTESEAPARLSACTDAAGEWRIGHVPPGRWLVEAGIPLDRSQWPLNEAGLAESGCEERPRHAPAEADVTVSAGSTTRVDLALPRPGAIAGRVLDASGRPVPEAVVVLEAVRSDALPGWSGNAVVAGAGFRIETWGDTASGVPTHRTLTRRLDAATSDERGEYRFDAAPTGTLRLGTHLPGQPAARASLEVMLPPGGTLLDADLVVPAGRDRSTRLVDRSGRPIAGARAWLEPEGTPVFGGEGHVTSDEQGRIEFPGVPARGHVLFVTHPDHATLWAPVPDGELRPVYVLEQALHLCLQVVDDEDGTPIPAFSLDVESEGMAMSTRIGNASGTTTIPMDDDGRCRVRVAAEGYLPWEREDLIPSHTARLPVEVRLRRKP